MFPYAIVRAPAVLDIDEKRWRTIEVDGLALIADDVGVAPAETPSAFMDTICAIAERQAVVPMRATSEAMTLDQVDRFMRSGSQRFHDLLSRTEAAAEWSVTFDPPSCCGVVDVAQSDIDDQTGGVGFLRARRRSQWSRDGVPRRDFADLERVLSVMTPIARDFRVAASRGASSVAMLVADDHESAMHARFREIAPTLLAPATLVGPWPAFSFVSADI